MVVPRFGAICRCMNLYAEYIFTPKYRRKTFFQEVRKEVRERRRTLGETKEGRVSEMTHECRSRAQIGTYSAETACALGVPGAEPVNVAPAIQTAQPATSWSRSLRQHL